MIFTIIGALVFMAVMLLSILIMCGLPLGEFTMGGAYKVFPKKLRIIMLFQIILQVFFVVIILQCGCIMSLWFSKKTTKIICIVIASYLSINTLMNLASKSKKEKYIMTPLSTLAAICYWITALS